MMEYIRLADAFDLRMGKTPSRSNPSYWGENNKWLSISDLSKCGKYVCVTKECITNTAVSESGMKIVPKGTVVMSFKLSIGKTAITTEDMYTNEAIMAFFDKHNYAIDVDYIYHLFCSKDWSLGTNSAVMGATLNKATLSDIYIPLPDLSAQRRIAATLDKVSEGIALCKQMLEDLDELVKSQFVEMFGDPVKNEKAWAIKPIKELYSVGSSKRIYAAEQTTVGVPFLRVSDICSLIDGDNVQPSLYISEDKFAELESNNLVPTANDILVTSRGTIGRCYIIKASDKFYFQDGMVTWLKQKGFDIEPLYVSTLFAANSFSELLDKATNKTTVHYISIDKLAAIPIPMPPIELQKQFTAFVEQTYKSKLAVQHLLAELETLKKSLMQIYFG